MAKVCTTIRLLVRMVAQLKYMAILALTRVGLFKPQEEEDDYSGDHSSAAADRNGFVLMPDVSSPTLVQVPVAAITTVIKMRVPVVPYGDFLDKGGDGDGGDGLSCAVCWDCVERSHEIRQLSNCSHVFHRNCLDRWVDEGQVSCPLCRSMLLPANTNPWLVIRSAYLYSLQLPPPPNF